MPLSPAEIRDRAIAFSREFRDATSERADAQLFWRDFFGVFGVHPRRVGGFERPVRNLFTQSGRGRIDFLWPGKVLVEHKSRGEDLDAAGRQARLYFDGLSDADLPPFVLVSDFARIRIHDLDRGEEFEFPLADLHRHTGRFGFLSGYAERPPVPTDPVNAQAVEALGALHDALEDQGGYTGADLDAWMVRALFCLFADSASVFEPGVFRDWLRARTREDGSDLGSAMAQLHQVLDTPEHKRAAMLAEAFAGFRYVNGELFRQPVAIPATDRAMRERLLDACRVDWKAVSPAVFGSLFQSIKNRRERRARGEHYTTEENILKCLDPLLLDALREAERAATTRERQDALLARLARIRVFDPACGCGNFLVVAYRELRRVELSVLRRRFGAEVAALAASGVNVNQMYGLEVEDWPAQIARVALWLTDHQMNMELSQEFGELRLRLPLTVAPRIRVGNALREDWAAFCPPGDGVVCVGNPPFVGAKMMSAEQRADVGHVFGRAKNAGLLDYVACWHLKACEWMAGDLRAEACFVSTNSITQGEQPAVLWAELWARGAMVNFAHRTFQWTSEARGKAAVHCVIVGLGLRDRARKRLWEYDAARGPAREVEAVRAINPYLVDGPIVALPRRNRPLWDVPRLVIGNQAIDGGHLLFEDAEAAAFLRDEPAARSFLKPFLGADEFLYNEKRWVLDLREAEPGVLRGLPMARERLRKVQAFRAASRRPQTVELSKTPALLGIGIYPTKRYLVVPRHSGEDRRFVPMAFVKPDVVCGDHNMLAEDATPYHLGVLSSTMHMAWVRAVCGRLKSDFRYSTGIVYNNFPWPDPDEAARARIEARAQAVLDARAAHPGASLADLYDPLAMPKNLADAHRALDAAVDAAYGATPRGGWRSEAARVAFLFARYQARAAPLDAAPAKAKPRRRARAAAEEGLL